MSQVSFEKLVADSGTAFSGGNYEIALQLAKKAIDEDPDKPEGYYAAGRACMSMDKADEATSYYKNAIKKDQRNGNGYFLLGYSQAMAGDTASSLRSFTKALENNCDESLKGQVYKIMSMINTDQGDYDNALLNLKQAEKYLGVDPELLQQKAGCYASQKNYRDTIFTLNQLKLLQPKDYNAYSLAFKVFLELGLYDDAKDELDRALKFADIDINYYNDCIAYAYLSDPQGEDAARYQRTLAALDKALQKGKPSADEVFEFYLRAAQTYVSLEDPDKALDCLDAAVTPVESFNNGFSVLRIVDPQNNGSSVAVLSAEEEEELMEEKWDNGEFDELTERIDEMLDELDEDDAEQVSEEIQKYLTPADDLSGADDNHTDESDSLNDVFDIDDVQRDMLNALYISAYELKKDYDKILEKAIELQSSSFVANQYLGIYYELKVGKIKNSPNWERKYRDRLNFWTKRMLEDPTDAVSASYRIRCYIDLKDFENAELLCSCLPSELKEQMNEEICKAKEEGN